MKERKKETLAAAAVCKPPIPGLLLIFASSYSSETTFLQ